MGSSGDREPAAGFATPSRAAGSPDGVLVVRDTDVSFFLVTLGGGSNLERAAPGTVGGSLFFVRTARFNFSDD